MHAKSWPLCDIQDELCLDTQYLLQHHKPQEPTNSVEFVVKLLAQVEHWQVIQEEIILFNIFM